MPEGDTIFRTARTLQKALAGKTITAFETMFPSLNRIQVDQGIVGRSVLSVESRGKWCLLHLSDDVTLLTHMLMSGSWHIYRIGEAWQRSRSTMRILLQTEDFVAVGFDIPVAEFHTQQSLLRRPGLAKLGPDVLQETFDASQVEKQIRKHGPEEIGEVLLNQQVLAGVGNVYKSEICFLSRIHPFRTVQQLSDVELRTAIQNAQRLLRANVHEGAGDQIVTYTGPRRTTNRMDPSARLWVYGRKGDPCRRCGDIIQMRKQGIGARVTFWCPRCQPF